MIMIISVTDGISNRNTNSKIITPSVILIQKGLHQKPANCEAESYILITLQSVIIQYNQSEQYEQDCRAFMHL